MALIKCHECKRKISDQAEQCPQCGAYKKDRPVQPPLSKGFKGYFLAYIGGVFGGPLGCVVSPFVLYRLKRTMKEKDGQNPNIFKRWALIGIVAAPLCWVPLNLLPETDVSEKKASNNFVTEEMYGEKWPFTVDKGALFCNGDAIYFGAYGKFYALNGTAAAGFKYPYPHKIWKDNPAMPGTKMSTLDLPDKARSLCK